MHNYLKFNRIRITLSKFKIRFLTQFNTQSKENVTVGCVDKLNSMVL